MNDFKLQNEVRDLVVTENGDLEVIGSEVENNLQRLNIRLRTYRGEWFLDTNEGIPWIQELLNTRNNKAAVDTAIRQAIINTQGIVSILSYESEQDTGSHLYRVSVVVSSSDGNQGTIELEV